MRARLIGQESNQSRKGNESAKWLFLLNQSEEEAKEKSVSNEVQAVKKEFLEVGNTRNFFTI